MYVKMEMGNGFMVQVGNCFDCICIGVYREEFFGRGFYNLIYKQSISVVVSISGSNYQWVVIYVFDNVIDWGSFIQVVRILRKEKNWGIIIFINNLNIDCGIGGYFRYVSGLNDELIRGRAFIIQCFSSGDDFRIWIYGKDFINVFIFDFINEGRLIDGRDQND